MIPKGNAALNFKQQHLLESVNRDTNLDSSFIPKVEFDSVGTRVVELDYGHEQLVRFAHGLRLRGCLLIADPLQAGVAPAHAGVDPLPYGVAAPDAGVAPLGADGPAPHVSPVVYLWSTW
ncbi:hypothetical protein PGQ11_014611 [Apiospora arundinis]|uniref:Uncharacterized protein n=1 Tax=Apiospora arundinis TaxID=335852 RepID=A0ABR2HU47_9PEZI